MRREGDASESPAGRRRRLPILAALLALLFPGVALAVFSNGGFEDGTLGGWTLVTYFNPGITIPPTSETSLNLQGGGSVLTYARSGVTPESQIPAGLGESASLRYPKFGSYSAVINELGASNNGNYIEQTITVSASDVDAADGKIHVRFVVAPVLENPGHGADAQPYYYVAVRNLTKGLDLFQKFNYSNEAGVPWKSFGGTLYTDWISVDIAPGEASLAIGDQVRLRVYAAGCSAGGHYGHVYVDAFGSNLPGLSVTATGPEAANQGSTITYTLSYRNGGTSAYTDSIVDQVLPAQTTFLSVSAPGGTCTTPSVGGAGTVSCNVGTVNAGASGQLLVTVSIDAAATGTVNNGNYSVRADGYSPILGPLLVTSVTAGVVYSDLAITKTDGRAAVGWGDAVTYTIAVTNNGPGDANGATVADTVPAHLTGATWTCAAAGGAACSASGSGSIADTVNLPSGGSLVYTLSAAVESGSGSATMTNLARVAVPGGVTDNDSSNNTAVDTDAIGALVSLDVAKAGGGRGMVVSSPAAITCGAACASASASFLDGAFVSLSAAAAPGQVFTGWGGACSGSTSPCNLTLSGNTSVTAGFSPLPPTAADDSYTTGEDTPVIVAAPGVLGNDNDPQGDSLSAVLVTGPTLGTLTLDPDGGFSYSPTADRNGVDSFTYRASDGVLSSGVVTVTIGVTAANDAPSFVKGADQVALGFGGPVSVAAWATAISAGPADESGQSLAFLVTNDQNGLFDVQPGVSASGTLTFTPKPGTNGVATVSVRARDDGGVASGGADTSAPQTFTMRVVDLTVNTDDDANDGACDGVHCSLREAILAGNTVAGTKPIRFAIPGPGPHTIRPTSPLPALTAPATLDAGCDAGAPLLELDGTLAGFGTTGLRVRGGATLVRGFAINRFEGHGLVISGLGGNTVQCSFVGTDSTGLLPMGNGGNGIQVVNVGNNTIGGGGSGEGNILSANGQSGVRLDSIGTTANRILGNRIGTGVDGTTDLGNGASGVTLLGASGNFVGGTGVGEGNVIGYNNVNGVLVSTGSANAIRRNSIFDDTRQGIELSNDGPTANDPGDTDTGANELQNYPVLVLANASGGATGLKGTLSTHAGAAYSLEFFSSASCDLAGAGEGASYIGTVDVTTDGSGQAAFTAVLASTPVGSAVTATATSASGDTSEFSACLAVAAAPSVSVGDASTPERGALGFPVALSAASGQTVAVAWTAAAGTATTADGDYLSAAGTVTFLPGETAKVVTVAVADDARDEDDETLFLDLTGASAATVARGRATGTILDDDAPPTVSIGDGAVTEGDSGSAGLDLSVSLSAASGRTVSVAWATEDESASVADGDYRAASGLLTFAPGETSKTVTVAVNGDALDEDDETFVLRLSTPVNAVLGTAGGRGTIADDDATPTLAVGSISQPEGDTGSTDAAFGVTLSAPSGRAVSVAWATADGTATAGADYTAASGTLVIPRGVTSATLPVPVLGDTAVEADETLFVDLASPVNAGLGVGRGTGTIVDDDQPAVAVEDVKAREGQADPSPFVFTVRLAETSPHAVDLTYSTADGTAASGSDYVAATGSLDFAPGETEKTVSVDVLGDRRPEPNETFHLRVSTRVGAVEATGTIFNDDLPWADYNSDGRPDLLWQSQTIGEPYAWHLDGTTVIGGSWFDPKMTDVRWRVAGQTDLDGDGTTDILWHHQTTGDLYVWYLNGTNVVRGAYLQPRALDPVRWRMVGLIDLNADGQPDLLWHDQQAGGLYAWVMNGTSVASVVTLDGSMPDPQWRVQAVVDFDGDGQPDILWRHTGTGELYVWKLDGAHVASAVRFTPDRLSDQEWAFGTAMDYDGDGNLDLLWHHQKTGELYVWFLNGTTVVRAEYFTPRSYTSYLWRIAR